VRLAGDVVRHILRDGMRLMGVGVIVGLAGALGFSRFLESLRYQVRTYDPLVILSTIFVVAVVALIACWMPAWQATRFSAVAALRND
jgi:putative ABC transport system permease protein